MSVKESKAGSFYLAEVQVNIEDFFNFHLHTSSHPPVCCKRLISATLLTHTLPVIV